MPMSEVGAVLAEQVERALRDTANATSVLSDLGLDQAIVPEAEGGLGLEWPDLAATLDVWGRHAGDESLASLLVESWLSGRADRELSPADLRDAGLAVALSAQIAGALQGSLELAVEHVTTRQQFGRPLAKFQAIQRLAAELALETAAAKSAAHLALRLLDRAPILAAAIAKTRSSRAAGSGAALAHQMHGAIGVTEEYPLHHLSQRLWRWRDMAGGETTWAAVMGARYVAASTRPVWSRLVEDLDARGTE